MPSAQRRCSASPRAAIAILFIFIGQILDGKGATASLWPQLKRHIQSSTPQGVAVGMATHVRQDQARGGGASGASDQSGGFCGSAGRSCCRTTSGFQLLVSVWRSHGRCTWQGTLPYQDTAPWSAYRSMGNLGLSPVLSPASPSCSRSWCRRSRTRQHRHAGAHLHARPGRGDRRKRQGQGDQDREYGAQAVQGVGSFQVQWYVSLPYRSVNTRMRD